MPLIYDFAGSEQRYYEITYPRPAHRELAQDVAKPVAAPGQPVYQDPNRGLDHGAYVPLVEMFPEADVPVLQVSMPTLDPRELFETRPHPGPAARRGRADHRQRLHHAQPARSAPARDQRSRPGMGPRVRPLGQEAVESGDVDAVLNFRARAPAGHRAHPRTEHFAPLFVTLGATADHGSDAHTTIDGFWFGLSKRSFQFA